ncbi:MAG: hypothetical protein Q9180_002611, partial [Flavoplaca navasiana]
DRQRQYHFPPFAHPPHHRPGLSPPGPVVASSLFDRHPPSLTRHCLLQHQRSHTILPSNQANHFSPFRHTTSDPLSAAGGLSVIFSSIPYRRDPNPTSIFSEILAPQDGYIMAGALVTPVTDWKSWAYTSLQGTRIDIDWQPWLNGLWYNKLKDKKDSL